MRRLVYDVAVSVDGFIAGPDEDISGFLDKGDHVEAYFARLATYDAVIMGRGTYEIGYRFGMKPGDRPYPHMRHVVVSTTLQLPDGCDIEIARDGPLPAIDRLKSAPGGDIYLCGGGELAGALLSAGRLDALVLKVNPVLLGSGTPLFGPATCRPLRLLRSTPYSSGVVLQEYVIHDA